MLNGKYNEDEANVKANDNLIKREIVSFKDIKPCFIFINEDKQSFSIITNCAKNNFEYKKLLNFFNSEKFNKKDIEDLTDYKKLNQDDFIEEIKKVFNNNESINSIKKLIQHYVFTEDNFIKLLFILSRIRAKTPIILMGETGCGKTSLIRQISSLIEQQNKNRKKNNQMKIFNIHAGINDDDIIDFINKNNLLKDNYKNNNNEENWIFFDEINTRNSMGLLSEIICKHTLLGKKNKR